MGHKGNGPAPNAYNRDSKSCILKRTPAYGFGCSKRPTTTNDVPGPGSYALKTTNDSQGRSLGSRIPEVKTSNMLSPGPGTYNARLLNSSLG